MPGFLMHVGAVATCPHQIPATIAPSQAQVLVSGQPVATVADIITVAGCPFIVALKPQPCITVRWMMVAAQVLVNGSPALLLPSPGVAPAICQSPDQIPNGPAIVSSVQLKVIGK